MFRPSMLFSKVQSQLRRLSGKDAAIKFFEKQQNAIRSIKNTDGYSEIKDYFYRLYDEAASNVSNVDAKEV